MVSLLGRCVHCFMHIKAVTCLLSGPVCLLSSIASVCHTAYCCIIGWVKRDMPQSYCYTSHSCVHCVVTVLYGCRETGPPRPYEECSNNPYTVFVLTAHGGHCAHLPLGSWVTGKAWMDKVAMQFFSAVRVLSAKPGGPLHIYSNPYETAKVSASCEDGGHL